MRLVNVQAVEQYYNGFYYDKDSLVGVDLFADCPEEKSFCQLFPKVLSLGMAEIRIAKDCRLVLECKSGETRAIKMDKKQAERIEKCIFDSNYKRRVCFLNGGYNALAIRFIRNGCTKQALIIKQERN